MACDAEQEQLSNAALREERRLRVFENRVLREIFGPKSDEGTGEWRKLHNDMYSLRVRKISSQPGFDPRAVHPVASGYTE
jgi:hypothetical protein